jgi:hypothetical protein
VEATAAHAQGPAGRTKKLVGIALLAVGAGALAGGIATGVLANQAVADVNAEARAGQPFDPSKESAHNADVIASGVLLGVGGAAAVAGAVLVTFGIREAKLAASNHVALVPAISPTFQGAALSVAF